MAMQAESLPILFPTSMYLQGSAKVLWMQYPSCRRMIVQIQPQAHVLDRLPTRWVAWLQAIWLALKTSERCGTERDLAADVEILEGLGALPAPVGILGVRLDVMMKI